ncbi:MAG: putative toxin-antitoxin system toxin component, PIN family [Betaproteobacteria bacterium]|nr:putative toxin-antitoxin system toxin component, PIN family [Betaproteobacteria bacterium]
MRVVLDTNVVVSALLWGGMPKKLLELASEGAIDLTTSDTLLEELGRTLNRAKFSAKLVEHRTSAGEIVRKYRDRAVVVVVTALPTLVLRDPNDHHVIASAIAADAELLVTGDRDLLTLKTYRVIRIVNVAEALELIGRPA